MCLWLYPWRQPTSDHLSLDAGLLAISPEYLHLLAAGVIGPRQVGHVIDAFKHALMVAPSRRIYTCVGCGQAMTRCPLLTSGLLYVCVTLSLSLSLHHEYIRTRTFNPLACLLCGGSYKANYISYNKDTYTPP